jgi:hypothetical protein
MSATSSTDNGKASDSTFSTLSTGTHKLEDAIFPAGSWLERYMEFARKREESADSYLIGAILPVFGATAGRRVWFPWGDGKVYPNLFAMLAGKPGDRKSSAVNSAERLARRVIDKKCFLPSSLSVEALFDEYDEQSGGLPDKILIADDANPFLGLLQKTNYGERVGQQLLSLYDCKHLSEAFLRNKSESSGEARRFIEETSTSMVLGATFNICQFQGHEIRSGLQRRFLYYMAERHGRFIVIPARTDQAEFNVLCERLSNLSKLSFPFDFSPDALAFWADFQRQNRTRLEQPGSGAAHEALLSRLNGQPNHVLKLAMIFQLSRWAENSSISAPEIDLPTLQTAIEHSELCLASAQALDSIANRAQIEGDADVLLANIRHQFASQATNGEIFLTRTSLTAKYAHHSGRRGALTTHDLYLRLIPDLIRRKKAREIPHAGKPSSFAFKIENA